MTDWYLQSINSITPVKTTFRVGLVGPILTTRNLNAGVAVTDYGRGGGGPGGFRLRLAKLLGGYIHKINLLCLYSYLVHALDIT